MVQPCDKPCANKAQSGYCATTVCINPKYSNIGTAYFPNGVTKQIVTNAMKIRAMSDEELADYLEEVELAAVRAYGNDDLLLKGELREWWIKRLKEEAK